MTLLILPIWHKQDKACFINGEVALLDCLYFHTFFLGLFYLPAYISVAAFYNIQKLGAFFCSYTPIKIVEKV